MRASGAMRDASKVWNPGICSRVARLAVVATLPLLAHCSAAPRLDDVPPGHAIPPGNSTMLDRVIDAGLGDEPGMCAVRLIEQNSMAFGYRAATATSAQRSLDIQYYIWNNDLTGKLVAAEVLRAAERGVKVRVLVDDIDARAKHDLFQVADLHANIEVRIFNPFYSRSGWFGQLTEWLIRGRRLNRRMHNKAWIVDNRVAIVGGRNIGDEYFGASDQSNFADLDLVLAGPIVDQISASFDEYWNNPNAVPVDRFERKPPPPEALAQLIEDAAGVPPQRRATVRTSSRCRTCRSAPTCSPHSRRRSRYARWNCWSTIRRRSASELERRRIVTRDGGARADDA